MLKSGLRTFVLYEHDKIFKEYLAIFHNYAWNSLKNVKMTAWKNPRTKYLFRVNNKKTNSTSVSFNVIVGFN